jgi:UDP-2-acetamido-3-amino-2,3-dideoxy-glucuronate N-acetyltransferase
LSDKGIFVHPKAICESDYVGAGTRIWAFAHVMSGAKVGAHCNIGECSFIEKGAVLGDHCTVKNNVAVWEKVTCEDYVFLGPSCVLTNDLLPRCEFKRDPETEFLPTLIKRGASVGANAVILCGVTLGRYSMVGAGAVVTRDVPDFGLVFGNPAELKGYVCRCGTLLPDGVLRCSKCGGDYQFLKPLKGDGFNPHGLKPAEE